MNLQSKVMEDLKTAMKTKDKAALRGLRAIKSALLLVQTDGSGQEMNEAKEIAILQKLIKSRQDSFKIYEDQGRPDLAVVEVEEIAVIEKYLPTQLSEAELSVAIQDIITTAGATSMKDMGKIMGIANETLQGRADNRLVSAIVKQLLSA